MRLSVKSLMNGKILAGAAVALAVGLTAVGASAQQQKPEDVLKMRQGLMQAVKVQFGAIGAFAQGKGDLPTDAAQRAENLVALARISPIAWSKGGENIKGSETKAAAFTSADFTKGWENMAEEAAKLAEAAKGGNADAIKAAAAGLGKTCKGCHENFKE